MDQSKFEDVKDEYDGHSMYADILEADTDDDDDEDTDDNDDDDDDSSDDDDDVDDDISEE